MTKIKISYSLEHLKPKLWPQHGPWIWPKWKFFALRVIKLGMCKPSTGNRLWIYFRRGAIFIDLVFDRRENWWAKT